MDTAEQAAAILRDQIFTGRFPPGTVFQEVALAGSLGISRNTLREAVHLLAHEGLVKRNIHRGTSVTLLSTEDVEDLYRVRRELELSAMHSIQAATPAQLLPFQSILAALRDAIAAQNWPRAFECDSMFHCHMVSFLGSPRIDRFFQHLFGELRLGLILFDSQSRDSIGLLASHQKIYQLLADGEYTACREELRSHLMDAEQKLKETVSHWNLASGRRKS